ncbi:MAG TPA: hypothetical protein PL033_12920 [Candidatus Brocadiia bacterium]|nr:hypothetical protein [Candidatus Brocadiia bacterium]
MDRARSPLPAAVLLCATLFGSLASAQSIPQMKVPYHTVEEMGVLPLGPVRIISRNVFDVIASPLPLPAGPVADKDEESGPITETRIPPAADLERFEYKGGENDYHWPELKGFRFGTGLAGAIRRQGRLRYGFIVPFHHTEAEAKSTHCVAKPMTSGTFTMDIRHTCDVKVNASGVGAFSSYEILSEDEKDPVTVNIGAVGGWVLVCTSVEGTYDISYSSPVGSGYQRQEDTKHDYQNVGAAGPFLTASKDFGPVIIGLSSLCAFSVCDHGGQWYSRETMFGPIVGVPVHERVMLSASAVRGDILEDDRGPRDFPDCYYLLTGQVGVGIAPGIKVFAGARTTLGIEDYTAHSIFAGAAIIF